jgi:hypothetical protein
VSSTGVAGERAEHVAGGQPVAVPGVPFQAHAAELAEHFLGPGGAAQHRVLAGEDGGGGGVVRGDQAGGEVAVAQVFFQGEGDRAGQVVADVVGQGAVFIHSF